jgi:cation:H+ antiporter
MNSIVSSAVGHGDLNVGDSFGSILAQISLFLGLYALFAKKALKVKRDEIMVIGACEVLALIASVSMVEKGYISRFNALTLVASWPIFMLIIWKVTEKEHVESEVVHTNQKMLNHFLIAILGFIGVAAGSFVVVNSVITLSAGLHIPEYLISFFVVAIGTSLPEFAVELTAIRNNQYEVAIGDAIGSCIIDAGLSIGIGPLFFPVTVSGGLAETTGLYAMLVSIIVLSTLALREKLDKKAGVLFIALYLISYIMLYTRTFI